MLYILMQVGCPTCKTETKEIAAFDCLAKAESLLNKCNAELARMPREVEFKVFQVPEINKVPEYYKGKD